jgi:hypothetical protein
VAVIPVVRLGAISWSVIADRQGAMLSKIGWK